jgi:endonuclease/exonuclease/phosphatase family metal-dependent hydrolase
MLRVLTLNTHKGFSSFNTRFVLHRLRRAVHSTGADIVFLQEVLGEHARKARRYEGWPTTPQHIFLADPIWPDHAYGKNAVYRHGHHGNAILSRYPILHSTRVDVSTNRVEQRGFLHCVVQVPHYHRLLHCICVHLGLFVASRRKQYQMLGDYVERHIPAELPLIVAGDFNDWRGAVDGEFGMSLGLTDVTVATRGAKARTFPAWLPLFPLDRIYCRGLTARSSATYHRDNWARLSDHAGLFAEVTLPRAVSSLGQDAATPRP